MSLRQVRFRAKMLYLKRVLPEAWLKPGPESGLDCLICAESGLDCLIYALTVLYVPVEIVVGGTRKKTPGSAGKKRKDEPAPGPSLLLSRLELRYTHSLWALNTSPPILLHISVKLLFSN